MASNTLDILDKELREQADDAAARHDQAVAELLEKVKHPFEVWEDRAPLMHVFSILGGLAFVGFGVAILIGAVDLNDPLTAWGCIALGIVAVARGISELKPRGPLLRFTEQMLESNNCESIPWDAILDYEVEERSQNVLLLLDLKPGCAPKRKRRLPPLRLLRRDGRFIIEGDSPRDWTWDTVIERMEEYRTAAQLRREGITGATTPSA